MLRSFLIIWSLPPFARNQTSNIASSSTKLTSLPSPPLGLGHWGFDPRHGQGTYVLYLYTATEGGGHLASCWVGQRWRKTKGAYLKVLKSKVAAWLWAIRRSVVTQLHLVSLSAASGSSTAYCVVYIYGIYTGCFTTLGHNCRRWFPRSLWWKKFI